MIPILITAKIDFLTTVLESIPVLDSDSGTRIDSKMDLIPIPIP